MILRIAKWEPENFEPEMTTHWTFPKRGDWATHDAKWRGNWSPYIPRNILLRYSKENDIALERCKEKIDFEHNGADGKVYLHKGDARNLDFISDESIDLICTHLPYADIIKYSEDIDEDLSHLKVKEFLE